MKIVMLREKVYETIMTWKRPGSRDNLWSLREDCTSPGEISRESKNDHEMAKMREIPKIFQ